MCAISWIMLEWLCRIPYDLFSIIWYFPYKFTLGGYLFMGCNCSSEQLFLPANCPQAAEISLPLLFRMKTE